jgi:hypothetical protein
MAETSIDDVMKAYARDAVRAAARRDVALDYSERSLEAVDELLRRESFIGPTPRTPGSSEDEEILWMCSKMLGAYVGEVALHVLGGRWVDEPTVDGGVRPTIEVEGVKGFPIEKVWKRLTESEFDTVAGYCRVLRAIIDHRTIPGD